MTVDGGLLLLRTLEQDSRTETAVLMDAWCRVPDRPMRLLVRRERSALWLERRARILGLEGALPGPFHRWLGSEVRVGTARNLLIESRAWEMAQWLHRLGVPFVFIKGSARGLLGDVYPGIDARVTTDVDILLRMADARMFWDEMRKAGYEFAIDPAHLPTSHFHLMPLSTKDGVPVELHVSTAPGLAPEEAWRRATAGATVLDRHGMRLSVPSATEMLWLAIAHAEIDSAGGYDLKHFQDAAVLIGSPNVEWATIARRLDDPEETRERARMDSWLGAAASLAGCRLGSLNRSAYSPFDLPLALSWRFAVCRLAADHPRLVERLFDEGTRAAAGLPMARWVEGTACHGIAQRRIATLLARGMYVTWRASRRMPERREDRGGL